VEELIVRNQTDPHLKINILQPGCRTLSISQPRPLKNHNSIHRTCSRILTLKPSFWDLARNTGKPPITKQRFSIFPSFWRSTCMASELIWLSVRSRFTKYEATTRVIRNNGPSPSLSGVAALPATPVPDGLFTAI
jgi:hypothetical protein